MPKTPGEFVKWLRAARPCLLLPALPLLGTQAEKTRGAQAIARETDEHYNHLKTMKAEFTQLYEGGGPSPARKAASLWLKKPGRMRWEYNQPRKKLFLTDSQSAVFYVPGERQARRLP